ncbi:TMEM175 family protein [Sphingomonas xanthus]|uniref:DUF1211 domain-containing protein n=1 Tax=Sphingomonas xanthus TaxID=2594473 RepID=A0A516ITG0_9SPHN|nr:TMEM175 family protein [Sphingomonas xanthus]QDP20179.1 DUF1211 domain-containing protein [Sphingomonas xanthus]
MTERLDNFTDAAFAFAISLLVIGGARAPDNFDALVGALGDIPAFAFGFAVMAMFWLGHVRWRKARGEGDGLSLFLTLLLVFLTLVYVQPLRGMAAATGLWFTGQGQGFGGSLSGLFAVYGTGFVAMSLVMAGLWADTLRESGLTHAERCNSRGERGIWLIMAATGALSIIVSMTRFGLFAAMLYATLPMTIFWYTARHDWGEAKETA